MAWLPFKKSVLDYGFLPADGTQTAYIKTVAPTVLPDLVEFHKSGVIRGQNVGSFLIRWNFFLLFLLFSSRIVGTAGTVHDTYT